MGVLKGGHKGLLFDQLLLAKTASGDLVDAAHGEHLLGDRKEVWASHLLDFACEGWNVGGGRGGIGASRGSGSSAGHGDKGKGGNGEVGDVGASKHVWMCVS